MSIHNLYFKRGQELPDVFQYEELSVKFKNQCYHIWNEFLNQVVDRDKRFIQDLFKYIYDAILMEEGLKFLFEHNELRFNTHKQQIELYFDVTKDINKELTVLELIFQGTEIVEKLERENHIHFKISSKKAQEELNYRFKENGIGFQYESELIIKSSIKR